MRKRPLELYTISKAPTGVVHYLVLDYLVLVSISASDNSETSIRFLLLAGGVLPIESRFLGKNRFDAGLKTLPLTKQYSLNGV